VATPSIGQFWAIAGGASVLACWALFRFAASVRRDRVVEDTPLVKIRSAAQGYVKVSGHARPPPEGLTAAPLSSRPCVWWSFEVAERQRDSNNRVEWCSIERASSVTPFVLADDSGECLVGPVKAEITATAREVWYGGEQRPSGPPPIERVVFESSNYRYTESLLREGDQLCVVGELRSNSEIQREDEATSSLLKKWKQDQPALLARFDHNHDGRIDASEWEEARQAAAVEAKTGLLASPISRVSVIGEPINGQPFLIAPMDSAHLVQREKRRAVFYLLFGVACVVLCGWAIEHATMLARALSR
jgi:hypothetical protein